MATLTKEDLKTAKNDAKTAKTAFTDAYKNVCDSPAKENISALTAAAKAFGKATATVAKIEAKLG